MTVRVTVEDCLAIYSQDVHAGVLADRGKLEGAINGPFGGMYDYEFYPTVLEKAAQLTFRIAEAQAFTDGNKRLAWSVTVVFLDLNDTWLDLTEDEAAEAVWSLGRKTLDVRGLLDLYTERAHFRERHAAD